MDYRCVTRKKIHLNLFDIHLLYKLLRRNESTCNCGNLSNTPLILFATSCLINKRKCSSTKQIF